MLKSEISLEQYTTLLQDWSEHHVNNIHFTGGEATLHKQLPRFVKMAAEKNISSTLTTNGTADTELYRGLVENGLSEVRISIDSTDEEEFDGLVRVEGSCKKVKQNIASLVEMKKEDDLYLILNACVGSFNINTIKSTLNELMELQPDAIKLLVVAEDADNVQAEASREFVDELLSYVRKSGRDDELLERKISSMFRKDAAGISCPSSRQEMDKCFVPLTERTLDSRNIYPCSIYVRYKGTPIISAEASFAEQQEAINGFVDQHDCREDTICIDNCTNCCKEYNIKVNRKIKEDRILRKAYAEKVITVDRIFEDEVERFSRTCRMIQRIAASDESPFLIIKPQGMEHRKEIEEYLINQGIVLLKEKVINNWQNLSLFIYAADCEDIRFRIAKNQAHTQIDKSNLAVYLLLEEGIPEGKLARIKDELRHWYDEELRFMSYDGEGVLLRANCIHTPDYENLLWEKKVIAYFL